MTRERLIKAVRDHQRAHNMTQRDVAQAIGIHESQLSRVLSRSGFFQGAVLERVVEYLESAKADAQSGATESSD